jgi:hypothetical protein
MDMTDATELDALIAAVEAGSPWGDSERRLCLSALPKIKSGHGSRRLETHARNAYNGSLDAALALHEALLPGEWEYAIYSPSDSYSLFQVQLETPTMRLAAGFEPVSGEANTPARAWLIAILKAYRAQVAA